MTASIVIPTYNKMSRLRLMLESFQYTKIDSDMELILVNDGSTDDTRDFLIEFSGAVHIQPQITVRVINTENKGRSAARNTGIMHSSGDCIIFLDDDVLLGADTVTSHLAMHSRYADAVVHGKIYSLPHLKFFTDPLDGLMMNGQRAKGHLSSLVLNMQMFRDQSIIDYCNRYGKISKFEKDIEALYSKSNDNSFKWIGFTGGNVSVKKADLIKAGMFDEQMGVDWGCEDLELGYRLCKLGLRFFFCNQAEVYHMNHYRENSSKIHQNALDYFIGKHRDQSIASLSDYFDKQINTLLEWEETVKQQMADIPCLFGR